MSDYYNGDEFRQRALNAGFNEKDYKELVRELNEWLDATVYKGELLNTNKKGKTWLDVDKQAGRIVSAVKMNPYLSEKEYLDAILHEMAHGSTATYEKDKNAFYETIGKFYPQIKRMMEYDISI